MTTGDDLGGGLPAAGWYPDTANPDRERLWNGERWIDWIRPLKPGRTEATPAGWYPDAGHPGFERLWSGEMWTEEIRRVAVASAPPPPPPTAASVAAHPRQVPLQPVPRTLVSYRDDNPPYRLGGLGTWVMIGLGATVASSLAQLIANQIYIGVENDIIDGRSPSLSHVHSVAHAVHVTHAITFIVEVITAILFVIWFYRAYRNLVRVGISDLRFGPGWAAGGWFIPIFNLFRQKQIANDIWKASASAGSVGYARRREISLPSVLNWWWGTWIVSGLLVGIGSSVIRHANRDVYYSFSSVHLERSGVWWTQAGLVIAIAAAVLAILFVRDITRMQDDHFEARVPGVD